MGNFANPIVLQYTSKYMSHYSKHSWLINKLCAIKHYCQGILFQALSVFQKRKEEDIQNIGSHLQIHVATSPVFTLA